MRIYRLIPCLLVLLQGACSTSSKATPVGLNVGQVDASIEKFLKGYFSSWSACDFERYEACFSPGASIQFRSKSGKLKLYGLQEFMVTQRVIRKAGDGKVEVPLSIEVSEENGFRRCLVRWKLTSSDGQREGYDHFLLRPKGDSWEIVSLLYYND